MWNRRIVFSDMAHNPSPPNNVHLTFFMWKYRYLLFSFKLAKNMYFGHIHKNRSSYARKDSSVWVILNIKIYFCEKSLYITVLSFNFYKTGFNDFFFFFSKESKGVHSIRSIPNTAYVLHIICIMYCMLKSLYQLQLESLFITFQALEWICNYFVQLQYKLIDTCFPQYIRK